MDSQLQQKFVEALINLPATSSKSGRDSLLFGIPPNLVLSLNRSENIPYADIAGLMTQLDGLGRIESTGERPLIIVAQNALNQSRGSELGRKFQEIIDSLEAHYGGDEPSESLPETPEILVVEGRDERVNYDFIQQALHASKSVARLHVPRIKGNARGRGGYGTGWLISPTLLLTNHHVVNNRDYGTPPAEESDLRKQVEETTFWFDYHQEGGARVELNSARLIAWDIDLDYALLRLSEAEQMRDMHLKVSQAPPILESADRLNIVQHPRGGPLRYAIRSNYYIGEGEHSYHLRYLTDTEAGSSGSPVFTDSWDVIGLHRAFRKVPKHMYKGDTIKYHNEGVSIHTILDHISENMKLEIAQAQGWNS